MPAAPGSRPYSPRIRPLRLQYLGICCNGGKSFRRSSTAPGPGRGAGDRIPVTAVHFLTLPVDFDADSKLHRRRMSMRAQGSVSISAGRPPPVRDDPHLYGIGSYRICADFWSSAQSLDSTKSPQVAPQTGPASSCQPARNRMEPQSSLWEVAALAATVWSGQRVRPPRRAQKPTDSATGRTIS